MSSPGMLRQFVYRLGPYLMLEALLPGGTVLALLLFLYRGRKLNSGDETRGAALGVNGRARASWRASESGRQANIDERRVSTHSGSSRLSASGHLNLPGTSNTRARSPTAGPARHETC